MFAYLSGIGTACVCAILMSALEVNASEPEKLGDFRVATFNVSLYRQAKGDILADLQSGKHQQVQKVSEIIQRVRPDILLLNEIDYLADGSAIAALKARYLELAQDADVRPIHYPYIYIAQSNTGILSAYDLDNDGDTGADGNDALGYGAFEGQYGMALLSRYPIVEEGVRTFQKFLWKDMPNAKLPVDPARGESWYSDAELAVFRLSSKSHWDVPIMVGSEVIHILASHPTPPVFDGDEDRNGLRNHDEIRFWHDYVDPQKSDYIYDDTGKRGGLDTQKRFVILGDLNASENEGDATDDPIAMLFSSKFIDGSITPKSMGGRENSPDNPLAEMHTAGWKMRADYVIPSVFGLNVEASAVYWPAIADINYDLVGPDEQSSDHRLVWLDATIINGTPTHVKEVGGLTWSLNTIGYAVFCVLGMLGLYGAMRILKRR